MTDEKEFWKIRSEHYNNLKWVTEDSYIKSFISAAELDKNDLVLDVGTGTGVIAHALAPLVKEVIGLDKSQDMLEHSNWKENKYFIKRDIRNSIFCDNVFDKVTARMVFHHIIEDTQKAMDECHRVLKQGGKMILAEGVPPSIDVKEDYIEIFNIKEERLTFMEEDLIEMMKKSGFKNIKLLTHTMKEFSIKNWLKNSGLPKEKQDKIYELHINGSETFKKHYDMKITDDDCLITVKNIILVGEK